MAIADANKDGMLDYVELFRALNAAQRVEAAAVAAAAAEAAERRTELEVLLEDCGLASFRAAVAAAAGGETAGHIKALGSKEALMALGMPKIRAVKLWRAVLEVCPKTLLCCRRLGFVCSLPQLVSMP